MQQSLAWAMINCVLNKYLEVSPPFHLTEDDVHMELERQMIIPPGYQPDIIGRGLRGKIAVQYYLTH